MEIFRKDDINKANQRSEELLIGTERLYNQTKPRPEELFSVADRRYNQTKPKDLESADQWSRK
jgi:hypothetical protein